MNLRRSDLNFRRCLIGALLPILSVGLAPAAPEPRPEPSMCYDVAVRDGTLYAAHTGLLLARDLSDPANPRLVGRASVPGEAYGVTLDGARAYVANGLHGVSIVALEDPWVPIVIGRYNTPGSVRQVAVQNGIAALADDIRGLELVDLSNPEKPRSLASLPTRDRLRAVAWKGTLLATAEADGGVRIFDLTQPASPRLIATLDAVRPISDVALCDDRIVAAAAGAKGVAIYAPARDGVLRLAKTFETGGRALALTCSGRTLVVSESGSRIEFIDLTRPEVPISIESVTLQRGTSVSHPVIDGNIVYAAAGPAGLAVLRRTQGMPTEVLLPRPRKMTITFP